MVFNGQVLWQGECALPAPIRFPVLRYGENSYVNAVFDYVETQMAEEENEDNS